MLHIQIYRKQLCIPVIQEEVHHRFILIRVIGACGINELSGLLQEIKGPEQDPLLLFRKPCLAFTIPVPCLFMRHPERPLTGAGNIGKNKIKPMLSRKLLCSIGRCNSI